MLDLNAKQLYKYCKEAGLIKTAKKTAKIWVRDAYPQEVIETWINDELETKKTAGIDEVVVQAITKDKEEYLISVELLNKRYERTKKKQIKKGLWWRLYEPKGFAYVFEYHGPSATFMAPWDELMIIHPGDYLATTDGNEDSVYRIERGAFDQTYTFNF